MYFFFNFVLHDFFSRILLTLLLSVVPKFMFFRIIWVNNFNACTKQRQFCNFLLYIFLVISNFVRNVRNYEVMGWNVPRMIVNLSVKSKNYFFFDFLRMFAAQSAVSVQPQTLELFLLGWLSPFVNSRVHRFAKSDYWLCNDCPSFCVSLYVPMDQLSSDWNNFIEIWFLNIF